MQITHSFTYGAGPTKVSGAQWDGVTAHTATFGITSQAANHTVASTDDLIRCTAGSGADITMTLPTAVGRSGAAFFFKRIDAGTANVIIATTSAQTIDGITTYTLSNQYQYVWVVSNGSNWDVIGQN